MHFSQLLMRQRRPKIPVSLVNQVDGLLYGRMLQPMVARFAAALTHQPRCPVHLIRPIQTLHLTKTDP